ncbi:hypothetical protein, partial [Marinimicrobium locisalis]|uniref:hypothetical protein n=1 Tax=Marinimicrobium locisalis TaxID=546022 RepID=UPI003D2FD793
FNQAENADTDPNTLAPLLGFTPKPKADYTLVVVDTQAPGAGQSVTLVPTYENMAKLAKGEIKGVDPAQVDKVMTPEYSAKYEQHMTAFEKDGLDVRKRRDINDYADEKISSVEGKEQFKARATIHGEFGANQHFTGDGTTKNLLTDGGNRGAVETYTLDKNPKTLNDLENRGSAKRLSAKRL